MESRFIVSASVAAALHALALFGFNTPPAPKPVPVKMVEQAIELFRIVDPKEPEASSEVASEAAPKRAEEDFRPPTEETPSKLPGVFEQRMDRTPRPMVLTSPRKIPKGPVGVIGGIEGGVGSGPGAVFSLAHLDNEPRAKARVAPIYPADARSAKLTGEVVVEFVVDESGRVSNARVVRSDHTVFEAATLRAVEKWRFEPGRKNGRAVRFRMAVPVRFDLSD